MSKEKSISQSESKISSHPDSIMHKLPIEEKTPLIAQDIQNELLKLKKIRAKQE